MNLGSVCADITLPAFEGAGHGNTSAAERSYSAQAALCVWRVDHAPNDPGLLAAKGGAAGRRVCCNAHLEAGFPPQWLIGVDRLRCKWLNLNLLAAEGRTRFPLAFLIDEFSAPESESWHGPGRTTRLTPTAGHS